MNNKVFNDFPIYVIFMPNREKYIKNVMKKYQFEPIYINAVNRDNLPSLSELLKKKVITKYFLFKELNYEGYPETPLEIIEEKFKSRVREIKGVIGLQLSYLYIFELFVKTGKSHCIIFEDDIIFNKKMKNFKISRLKSIFNIELKNKEWDIINMGRCCDVCSINKFYSKNLVTSTIPFCTHAMGYSKRVAEETLLNSVPMNRTGDWLLLLFFFQNPKYLCLSTKGNIFDQEPSLGTMLGHDQKLIDCKEKGCKLPKRLKKIE